MFESAYRETGDVDKFLMRVRNVAMLKENAFHLRFEVRSVRFADESLWKGYACEAVIKPEATTSSSEVSSDTFSSESALEIIDEVVPIAQRGKLIKR